MTRFPLCLLFLNWVSGSDPTSDLLDSTKLTCSMPLGLTTRAIEDWQLAASSVRPRSEDPHCAVKYARLHQQGSRAWCAEKKTRSEWILIDLGVSSEVSGVVTQGRSEVDEWVTKFLISYSTDALKWEFARDIYGDKKVFKGNGNAHSLRHSYLEHPVEARFVRIHVLSWHGHPSLRLEIVGCQECNHIISVTPFTEISASSHKRWRKRNKSCMPDMGDINSMKGWCPRRQNEDQWLQFDLGPPTTITGLVTRGQGDKKRFVTSYTMSYSNDSSLWFFYKDANHLEAKIFGGNMDRATERRHYLNQPVNGRYVRLHPLTWHKRIGMRGAVIGCPHKGQCGPGFMQVNSGSACVPNKAFNQKTWVNDKRQSISQWRYGHSSLAADGNLDASLANCANLDSYYTDTPVWMVDLGRESDINGVVVLTWQGAGQDRITSYNDYVLNLDKFTVYVSRRRIESAADLGYNSKCGSVTRLNNALFNPRLHVECPEQKKGRYVYVKATGATNRWRKLFNVVLCEVMVY